MSELNSKSTAVKKADDRQKYLNIFDMLSIFLKEGIQNEKCWDRKKDFYIVQGTNRCEIGKFLRTKKENNSTFVQFFVFQNIYDQETNLLLEELKDVYFTDYSGEKKNLIVNEFGEKNVESICQIGENVKF